VHACIQSLPQFGQCEIRLSLQLPPQILFHRFRRPAGWSMSPLRRPLHLSRLQLLPPNLLCETIADTKLTRQLFQADLGSFVCLKKLAPQIIRICFWHRLCLRGEIANCNVLQFVFSGYDYLGTALSQTRAQLPVDYVPPPIPLAEPAHRSPLGTSLRCLMSFSASAIQLTKRNPADYFYSAATHRSRGALWPIFAPARIPPRPPRQGQRGQ